MSENNEHRLSKACPVPITTQGTLTIQLIDLGLAREIIQAFELEGVFMSKSQTRPSLLLTTDRSESYLK